MSASSILKNHRTDLTIHDNDDHSNRISGRLPVERIRPVHIQSWWPVVEHMALTRAQDRQRCVGITSVDGGDGTSTFADMLADVSARSGRSTLLVDFSSAAVETPTYWSPQDGNLTSNVVLDHQPALLVARPLAANRLHFNDVSRIRMMFAETFASYDSIFVDLAPLTHPPLNGINPLPAAAACDAVILIGSRGRMSRAALKLAFDLGHSAKVNFAGVILNDRHYIPPSTEISQATRSALWFFPPAYKWIQARMRGSTLFN